MESLNPMLLTFLNALMLGCESQSQAWDRGERLRKLLENGESVAVSEETKKEEASAT